MPGFKSLAALVFFALVFSRPAPGQGAPVRERLNFNAGWLFQRDDPADVHDKELDYETLKPYLLADTNAFSKAEPAPVQTGNPGGDVSYTKTDFDDKGWRPLSLPHDWAIEGPFDIYLPGETGKLPWVGTGWYRKHFSLSASDEGRRLFLDIDGAMSYSEVWVNGQFAGGWPYGYQSFRIDLTPYARLGPNVVAIRLTNPPASSRWYPGAGLYRNTWLVKTSPLHIEKDGLYVSTPQVTADEAAVALQATIFNQSQADAETQTTVSIYRLDSNGKKTGPPIVTSPPIPLRVPAGQRADLTGQVTVPHPALWDLQHTNRYIAVADVQVAGQTVDRDEAPFGIRTTRFDPEQGFFLNGTRVPLNGVCGHADFGALGTAFNLSAARRQLTILKEMGCNAFRTSHNPPAPELLDLCDEMGFLVMDETFDCWRQGKKANDYHLLFNDWYERDLRAEFRRDRNHPSVIIWSLGNEMPDLGADDRAVLAGKMTAIAHDEDPTRPTAVASNDQDSWKNGPGANKGIQAGLDLYGQNYPQFGHAKSWEMLESFHAANPNKPIFDSETSSAVSSRGCYFFPVSNDLNSAMRDNQVSSYDLVAPIWACIPDLDFAALDRCTFDAGEFVWTGFDYLGEPTPYNSDAAEMLNFHDPAQRAAYAEKMKQQGQTPGPSRSSYFGAIDLAGFPKDMFYLYQARWRPDFPMAHILPHWNWPNRVGQVTPVSVYTSGDEAELFLNGQSLGRRKKAGPEALPANLALNKPASASSEEAATHSRAANANDGSPDSRWCAADGSPQQWWQVDLGAVQPIRSILLNFEMSRDHYQYQVDTSTDGTQWTPVATQDKFEGDTPTIVYPVDTSARYVRINFTKLGPRAYASLYEVGIYAKEVTPDSFIQDHYRLRWTDVVYQPGELKVVAYKDGKPWAEDTVKTTGDAAALALAADRPTIQGDGRDLCFVTTRVVDANGLMVPTANNRIKYEIVDGPGEIVATDNGDATDLEIFSKPERRAFNGLALAIIRAQPGSTGDIHVRATADGLTAAELTVHANPVAPW